MEWLRRPTIRDSFAAGCVLPDLHSYVRVLCASWALKIVACSCAGCAQGADPWAVDKLGGRTSLHYAARTDNTEILELLIDAAGSSGRVQFPNRPNTRSAHLVPLAAAAPRELAAGMQVSCPQQCVQ